MDYKAIILLLTVFVLVFSGCGRKAADRAPVLAEALEEPSPVPGEARKMAPAPQNALSAKSMAMAETGEQQDTFSSSPEVQDERKRIYSGFAKLAVESVDNRKEDLIKLAEESGGYVEAVYDFTVIIRVPASKFDGLFAAVLEFGDVLFKSAETVDVSEAFSDLSSRLDIAEKARERLYILLGKTDDVDERLKILREIRRLTEEIEQIRLTLTGLSKLVAFSRIEVELVPRLSGQEIKKTIPFPWIEKLSPLNASITRIAGKVSFPLDESFARFDNERYYRAENASGVRFRCGSIDNNPEGSEEFWQDSLVFHLSGLYETYEKIALSGGAVLSVVFKSKDSDPFHYLVGVSVRKKRLYVIEAFFPSDGTFKESFDTVKKMIEGAVLP